jgi:hypothetical protein
MPCRLAGCSHSRVVVDDDVLPSWRLDVCWCAAAAAQQRLHVSAAARLRLRLRVGSGGLALGLRGGSGLVERGTWATGGLAGHLGLRGGRVD